MERERWRGSWWRWWWARNEDDMNFYTSVPLFVDLFIRGTCAVGTVRKTRKLLPQEVVNTAAIKAMNRGDVIFRRSLYLMCVAQEDTRDITLLLTCHAVVRMPTSLAVPRKLEYMLSFKCLHPLLSSTTISSWVV